MLHVVVEHWHGDDSGQSRHSGDGDSYKVPG